ncbi:MAG: hypothetical protein KBC47_03840 [Candidatus Peribacteraceae bacterium]|nr:hypothetical protein [Candidatus Peribacteraceae bacterium]
MATESNNSIIVAIVAIIAVFVIAYFGLMLFNDQSATTGGTTAGIDVNLGTTGGDNPPANAQ